MRRILTILAAMLLFQALGGAGNPSKSPIEHIRTFTRQVEFDYIQWTLNAVGLKLGQIALGTEKYLDEDEQTHLVHSYIELITDIQIDESQLAILHADPHPAYVQNQIEAYQNELNDLYAHRIQMAPFAESIMQAQASFILAQQSLTSGGQPLPPLLFHITPLPLALVVSPRTSISQLANLSLETDLSLEEQINLEYQVASNLNVSTLVVPVGGVGTYPTMVAQSSALDWVTQTISHEWTHNYLTWHPLGLHYAKSAELTTMNETTANIVGSEVGAALIARFYPELVPAPQPSPSNAKNSPPTPREFDFRREMHDTRVHVDELLAIGKVQEAENYMETRRLIFWEHGYAIRKLNQAYFAFYGSYADTPIGPAGEDPVGAAVRELRARSSTLAEFLDRMAQLTSLEDLQALIEQLK